MYVSYACMEPTWNKSIIKDPQAWSRVISAEVAMQELV
jgi:hypothetical protein